MATQVRLPQAGMGMTDGTVMEWLKAVGDEVHAGECIAEVEAAKTTVEIEAPCDGVLAEIVAPVGTLVPVRDVMAVIAAPGEVSGAGAAVAGGAGAAAEVQVVPAARRLAREHGIALGGVRGSGPGGRITEADVQARIEGAGPVSLTGTRGLIARRMLASIQGSAQYTLVRTADVTELAACELPGTYTDAVARAVVLSLAGHPNLNARITGEQIRVATTICLGIGIDTSDGLVVGVLRDAGGLGLAELAAARKAIAERVRAGRADVADLEGSTFTISNLGALGVDAFTPIINPPEVAILGVGRVADSAVPGAGGGVAWRQTMTLSLTVDHRAVDGAPAARFLAAVADRLATPDALR